ncbi:SAPS-domain-containing protein [Linderina pennispora]|uniref:SAPS-domain-containing protein n=1 Tax=Linderina pennispora TaxID=61395 RepID=A0A1Y1WNB7_9FUNG|nr:SAPS-domain-containing protein [Linderina pennispora]ORX75041.1 SAPS-domain-containing protein [Linderina pennispora]
MLWRFGLQHASNIDKLLEKEDLTLEEFLNDPDLLQEVREQNPKPQNMKQMVDYIASDGFFKFSKMASTSCESRWIAEFTPQDFIEEDEDDEDDGEGESEGEGEGNSDRSNVNTDKQGDAGSRSAPPIEDQTPRQYLLETLWAVMRLPTGELDALQATHFSRVLCGILQRKPYETLDFIRAQEGAVELFLQHIDVSAIVDLLLKVISLEELDEGPSIIAWLSQYRLIPMLVDRLAPDQDPETHSLAAQPTIGTNALIDELKSEATVTRLADYMLSRTGPHATSTLINCVYIFIELIRRNYSDTDSNELSPEDQGGYNSFGEYETGSYDQHGNPARALPTVDLSAMMKVLALRINDLVELLKTPRSSTEPVATTLGLREPLGFERLRICELFAELLHCSNMPRLNLPLGSHELLPEDGSFKDKPTATTAPNTTAAAAAAASVPTETEDDAYGTIPLEIGDPNDHDETNTPVGQLLKWNLIRYKVLPMCVDLFFRFPLNNFLHSVVYDMMHQVLNLPLNLECNVALVVVAFRDVRITSRIARACAENDEICQEPKGVRLGYMGHLTGIGEEVARLLELSGAALESLISPYINGDEWLDYVARTLQEVRERDQQPLGGERPGLDMLEADDSSQVFVSRMGLVDPSTGETYDPEEDEDDDDDDDSEDNARSFSGMGNDNDLASSSSRHPPSGSLLGPNEDDEIDYINTDTERYFAPCGPSVDDDDEQFIIKGVGGPGDDHSSDEEDRDSSDGEGIGPAGNIGRFHSYQNETSRSVVARDMRNDDDEVDGDDDDASEMGRMNDYLRNRAADLAESTRLHAAKRHEEQQQQAEDDGAFVPLRSENPPLVLAPCENEEPLGATNDKPALQHQLARLSLDSSPHHTPILPEPSTEPPLPSYLLSLKPLSNDGPRQAPAAAPVNVPPPIPPRPQLGHHHRINELSQFSDDDDDDDFGPVRRRTMSSSELEDVVSRDLHGWTPFAPVTEEEPVELSTSTPPLPIPERPTSSEKKQQPRSAPGSVGGVGRRQRSRSQSAGVGISRAMVIQAASQGQFPFLDASTCEFVGQLKGDVITLGGAAAGNRGARQRSHTASAQLLKTKAGLAVGSGGSLSASSSPISSSFNIPRPAPPSGLRSFPMESLSLGSGSTPAVTRSSRVNSGGIDILPDFPLIPVSPEIKRGSGIGGLYGFGGGSSGGHSRTMMAPADDDDESTNWADFSTFASHAAIPATSTDADDDDEFGDWHGAPTSQPSVSGTSAATKGSNRDTLHRSPSTK